jgi:hypothetical protein
MKNQQNKDDARLNDLISSIGMTAEVDQALAAVSTIGHMTATYYTALRQDGLPAAVALDLTKTFLAMAIMNNKGGV